MSIDQDELAKSLVDLVERVEEEQNLEPGTLMQAWVDEYNSRVEKLEKPKERKVYDH